MDGVLSSQWRMLSRPPKCEPPPQGLDRLWHQAVGRIQRLSHTSSAFIDRAEAIKAREKKYTHLTDNQLRQQAADLGECFRRGHDTIEDRDRAFALVCEVAARTIGLRPYREQIAGALALDAGCIAEMATGEGKTLVATMPAVLGGWRGRGCHVITANDYLAQRDADLMRAVYRFCGLTVGCINPEMSPADRKKAYDAHITYGTNKEIAADFLRDRLLIAGSQGLASMLLSKIAGHGQDRIGQLVQRGLEYAIVDEADSVFIDEAVSPLLISGDGPNNEQLQAYAQAAELAVALDATEDYRVTAQYPHVALTPAGRQHLADMARPLGGLWTGARRREELVLQALLAKTVYERDKHYVVNEDKVVIVDEFTGRLMPDRTWRDGLHQAVEAKEGLPINLPKETYARISFQRFFRLYRKLAGMSGTVAEARAEMWEVYRLPVVPIPTHRPCQRVDLPDRVFTTMKAKWQAVIEATRLMQETKRPILIGTGSIRESKELSQRLRTVGIDHRLMNAVEHASEAQIISQAGHQGRITVSTNMAGRGTDIKLGPGVAQLGGLHVIATDRFSARRIDRQLSGRCSRQGDPGSAQAFISLEDELIQKDTHLLALAMRRFYCHNDRELKSKFWRRWVKEAQKRAERQSLRARRDVQTADNWLDQQLGFAAKEL